MINGVGAAGGVGVGGVGGDAEGFVNGGGKVFGFLRGAGGIAADFVGRADDVAAMHAATGPYAVEVLKRLVQTFRPKDIAVSSYGIREGLLLGMMATDRAPAP